MAIIKHVWVIAQKDIQYNACSILLDQTSLIIIFARYTI